jgi:hypothetical protein
MAGRRRESSSHSYDVPRVEPYEEELAIGFAISESLAQASASAQGRCTECNAILSKKQPDELVCRDCTDKIKRSQDNTAANQGISSSSRQRDQQQQQQQQQQQEPATKAPELVEENYWPNIHKYLKRNNRNRSHRGSGDGEHTKPVVNCFACQVELVIPGLQPENGEREHHKILGCGHVVGLACIQKWIITKLDDVNSGDQTPRCPYCREII